LWRTRLKRAEAAALDKIEGSAGSLLDPLILIVGAGPRGTLELTRLCRTPARPSTRRARSPVVRSGRPPPLLCFWLLGPSDT
jgi:hypothetical protein